MPLKPALAAPSVPPGEPRDFASIYEAHFTEVARWARALGGPDADAEDLAQEVFLVVRRKLAAFDGRNLPGWLYAIVRRTVSDYRRRAWFVKLFRGGRPLHESDEAAGSDPARDLERREDARRLDRLLGRLPETRRETFVLYEVLGYTGEEIASLQGIPVNTVWTRLHQARKEFMALVAADERGGGGA